MYTLARCWSNRRHVSKIMPTSSPELGLYLKLTHWGRVTHICVGKLTIIGSDNGLSPGRRQAIIWTNARKFIIGPLGTNFSEICVEILTFSFKKIRFKVSSAKWRPFCLGLNVLTGSEYMQRTITHTVCVLLCSGGRLNKKDGLTRYGNSHVKDKTS